MPHGNTSVSPRMGNMGGRGGRRLQMRSGDQDEELADLQRRFSALEDLSLIHI